MPETKNPTPLVKRVLANVADELEPYESPDLIYEFLHTLTTGRVPTTYRVVRVLAVASKLVKTLTRER